MRKTKQDLWINFLINHLVKKLILKTKLHEYQLIPKIAANLNMIRYVVLLLPETDLKPWLIESTILTLVAL